MLERGLWVSTQPCNPFTGFDILTTMADVVSITISDSVAILQISNPPVNALNTAVRQAICKHVSDAQHNASIHTIVITGSASAFSAGADISEFSGGVSGELHICLS